MTRDCRTPDCRRAPDPGEWYCADCLRAAIYDAFRPGREQGGARHAGGHPVDPRAVLLAATA